MQTHLFSVRMIVFNYLLIFVLFTADDLFMSKHSNKPEQQKGW